MTFICEDENGIWHLGERDRRSYGDTNGWFAQNERGEKRDLTDDEMEALGLG